MFLAFRKTTRPDVVRFLTAAGFLLSFTFALVHGAEYGFAKHTHDGVVCSLSLLQSEHGDVILPSSGWSISVTSVYAPRIIPDDVATTVSSLLRTTTRAPPLV